MWIPGNKSIAPIVWRVKWPREVVDRLVTDKNPAGDITNSDLEMAAEVLGFLVLEASVTTRHSHVGVCSDNSPTVAWQTKGASKRSDAANRLLRILAIRLRHNRTSPLVTRHLAGKRNHLGDIPSRSFGWKAAWHFDCDIDFLTFFNSVFPLPEQNCWTGFRLTSGVVSKVISELLTEGSPMDEWRQLPKLGQRYGRNGKPSADLSTQIPIWTASLFNKFPDLQQDLEERSGKASEASPSALEWSEPDLGVSTRRSRWIQANNPCIKRTASTS